MALLCLRGSDSDRSGGEKISFSSSEDDKQPSWSYDHIFPREYRASKLCNKFSSTGLNDLTFSTCSPRPDASSDVEKLTISAGL